MRLSELIDKCGEKGFKVEFMPASYRTYIKGAQEIKKASWWNVWLTNVDSDESLLEQGENKKQALKKAAELLGIIE